ncbi:glutaredoxin [Litorimonas taeanensis]|uniref:Methylamine utilization protein MauE n=1 Tax=Litorimonas taeanensis TaxID=568099 RepID=A0A420WFJ7_9PROT|nr:MauE/DoxX family redox-associated membrane protein [Litorimonas taeanensis]RKQ69767.1 glutaredoxin [Litorimonas taeanensis]
MTQKAVLYRMTKPVHLCPFGLKSKDLLRRKGFGIEDHHLTTRAETDEYKAENNVETTPQIFIDGKCIGGYTDLRRYFGLHVRTDEDTSYRPILAIFSVAALMALALFFGNGQPISYIRLIELFVAISMCVLAVQKLQDLQSFSTMFLGYDVLARKYVPYAFFYPFAEAGAGVLMLAGGLFGLIAAPFAFFIGAIGAWSVFKAVYIEKRELKCACAGGNSQVPLGFVSLSENVAMIGMAIWMVAKAYVY